MKILVKIFILFCLLLGAVASVMATSSDSTFNRRRSTTLFGFEVGLTNTNLYGTQLDLQLKTPGSSYQSKTGIQLGFIYKHEFVNFFYLKTGLSYVQKKGYVTGSGFLPENKIEADFITIPLIVGLQLVSGSNVNKVKLAIEGGISNSTIQNGGDNFESGLYPGQKISRTTMIQSLIIGANLEIDISNKLACFVNYRYSKDLNYYFWRRYSYNVGNKIEYKDYDVWIQNTSLTFGLLFNLNNAKK